jgi:hypothetical protein
LRRTWPTSSTDFGADVPVTTSFPRRRFTLDTAAASAIPQKVNLLQNQ